MTEIIDFSDIANHDKDNGLTEEQRKKLSQKFNIIDSAVMNLTEPIVEMLKQACVTKPEEVTLALYQIIIKHLQVHSEQREDLEEIKLKALNNHIDIVKHITDSIKED